MRTQQKKINSIAVDQWWRTCDPPSAVWLQLPSAPASMAQQSEMVEAGAEQHLERLRFPTLLFTTLKSRARDRQISYNIDSYDSEQLR